MIIYEFFTNPPFVFGDKFGYAEGFLSVAAFIAALFTAMTLHEVAHAYAAYKWGDNTAKLLGRLTLNPIKHIDPFGALAMLLFGFGWAKPVPVNPYNYRKRVAEVYVSLAGVTTNLFIAFISSFFFSLLYKIFITSGATIMNVSILYYVFYLAVTYFFMAMLLNLFFMLFNILPLYPLDGYRLLEYFFPRENSFMNFMRRYSSYILYGIIGLGIMCNYVGFYNPFDLYIGGISNFLLSVFLRLWGLLFGVRIPF